MLLNLKHEMKPLTVLNGNINKELCKIDKWLKLNKLSLNTTKSKFIIFHIPQKRVEIPIININNVNIECVANFDFLGVTIDKKLSWNGHTDKISLKLSRCVGILNKLKCFLPQRILLTIYNSMFLPHINYCILAWGYNHQRIFKIQKKVVRIISLSKYNAHTDPLFKHLKLLKMKDIHQIQQLKFYHKLIKNQTPKYFTSLDLVFNFENHEHNTRQRNYITHRVRHEYANLCVRNSLPYLLNNTDQIILNKTTSHSLHGFAIYIKNSILNTYKDECNIDNCYICLDRPSYKFAPHVFPTHSLVCSALDRCWSTVYDTGPALGQRGVNESSYRYLFSHCLRNSTYHACPANMLRWPVLVLVQSQ